MEGIALLVMGLLVFTALLLGIACGIAAVANIAISRKPQSKRTRSGANQRKLSTRPPSQVNGSANPAQPDESLQTAKERLIIARALNDDKSQTEFNCLADGEDMEAQILRQRERSNDSYNILSKKMK